MGDSRKVSLFGKQFISKKWFVLKILRPSIMIPRVRRIPLPGKKAVK